MKDKKTKYQKLEEKLSKQKKNAWEIWDDKTKKEAFDFAEKYKKFSNNSKTEREAIKASVDIAQKNQFKDLKKIKKIKPGDKIYYIHREKSLILAKIGKKNILNTGANLIMSHVDAPHLDFKVNPLYEDAELAFFKTHYYGGIKKYQWPTISLSIHGVVYLENGEKIEIKIGEKENDPIFMISDLLPHLDRSGGPGSKITPSTVEGEDLNLILGSIPVKDKKIKNKVKLSILEYLYKNYKIKENDLVSAELQAVPTEKTRDLGFDRGLLSGYAHDDRSCSFAALESFFNSKIKDKTQICLLIDREEIGSEGNTGAKSPFLENFISQILDLNNQAGNLKNVFQVFSLSEAISADVTSALDPDYKSVYDSRNTAHLNQGIALEKYIGHGGKYHTSEASAKFIAKLRKEFNKNKNLIYQFNGGLGKIDKGGGGTIAMYMANRDIEIIDAGIPVLNMHAPLEIISKADLYCTYLAYKIFFENE